MGFVRRDMSSVYLHQLAEWLHTAHARCNKEDSRESSPLPQILIKQFLFDMGISMDSVDKWLLNDATDDDRKLWEYCQMAEQSLLEEQMLFNKGVNSTACEAYLRQYHEYKPQGREKEVKKDDLSAYKKELVERERQKALNSKKNEDKPWNKT